AESEQQPWVVIENGLIVPVNSPEPPVPYPTISVNLQFTVKNYGIALPSWRTRALISNPSRTLTWPIPHRTACMIDAFAILLLSGYTSRTRPRTIQRPLAD